MEQSNDAACSNKCSEGGIEPPAENLDLVTDHRNEHRRPNLATIVGSGLAVVAAGSLLAFSTLAEQAGLQGLATGGISPTVPARSGNTRAIRLPAPTDIGEPERIVDPIDEIVRDAIARANERQTAPRTIAPAGPVDTGSRPEQRPEPRAQRSPKKPKKDHGRGVVVAARTTGEEEAPAATAEPTDGPPYGNAYGHYKHDKKKKVEKAKPEKSGHKHKSKAHKKEAPSAPVYARSRGKDEDEAPEWKPKKLKPKDAETADSGPGNGRGNGHSKHAHDNGKGQGKGHAKKGH